MSNIDINSEIRTQQQITDSGNPRKPTGDDGQKMLERMNESHCSHGLGVGTLEYK